MRATWVDAQIAIASHKSNVYVDLSGWSPRHFPPQLVAAIGRQLRTKALFGTDHPDAEVLPLILKDAGAVAMSQLIHCVRGTLPGCDAR